MHAKYWKPWPVIAIAGSIALRAVQPAAATCLPEAIALEDRVNIHDRGHEAGVGFWVGDWVSGWVVTNMAVILVQEVLGFNSSISGYGSSSYMYSYALAGCADPNNFATDPRCTANPRQVHYVALELWGAGKYQSLVEYLAHIPEVVPELGNTMGYEGIEGIYIKEPQLLAAWNDGGVTLEYYKQFNVEWYTPSSYFQSWDAFPPSEMMRCNETFLQLPSEMTKYVEVTGDLDGVIVDPASGEITSGKCWHDFWWFSPACRDQPETCVPYWTGSTGWGMIETMQQAAYHNMPIAIGVAATYSLYVANARKYDTVCYWWQPDASLIDFNPKRILFPPHNAAEHAQGIRITGRVGLPLNKVYHNRLWVVAPRLYDFLQRISLALSDVDEMIFMKVANESLTYEDVACDWLVNNEDIWRGWIPVRTNCVAGAGLADERGAHVAARSNAAKCSWCREGFYSEPLADDIGATFVCKQCEAGMSQESPGQTECSACRPGTFTEVNGSSSCTRCPVGTYQPSASSTACTPCPAPMVTFFQEATSLSDCSCPAGSYKPINRSACVDCPEGMTCAVNSSEAALPKPGMASDHPFPMAAAGFMTRWGAPLDAFKCQHVERCPGGGPGTCAANRDSTHIACARCQVDMYQAGDHQCLPCEGNESAAIVVVGILVGISILAMLTYAINKDMIAQPHAIMTCVLVCALLFMGIQTLGVFNSLDVHWVEPLRSMLAIMSVLTFDLDVIKVDCMVGSGPVPKYICRQLVAPVGVLIIALILVVKKQLGRVDWPKYLVELVNTSGAIFQVFFISIAISAWTPFVCYDHPGELGRSMVSSPSILCFDDDSHSAMAAIGILACLLVLLPFVSLVVYATWRYRQFVIDAQTSRGSGLLMYRFLFYRFTPQCYWYGMVLLSRNLCLCLVPVVIPTKLSSVQLCVMCFILQSAGILQLSLYPWRSILANWVDGTLAAALVMLLLCAAMSSEFQSVSVVVGALGSTILVLTLAFLVGILSYSVFQYFHPKPWYHKFICHHKMDAAAQARFLQVCLQLQGYCVFIDSDDLTNLDDLFDIVRSRIGQLIVYLTSSTLRRPWCAGEITVSFCSHKKVACVIMPSFIPPTEVDLNDLGTYIDVSNTNLGSYNINMDTIAKAFSWLLGGDVPSILVSKDLIGRAKYEFMVAGLLGNRAASPSTPNSMQPGAIVVVSDPADDEATAAAGILCNKIQQQVLSFARAGMWMLADSEKLAEGEITEYINVAHCVIIMLSQGSMESATQLFAIDAAMQRMENARASRIGGTAENPESQDADTTLAGPEAVGRVSSIVVSKGSTAMSEKSRSGTRSSADLCMARQSSTYKEAFQVIPVNIPSFKFPDEAYWSTSFPQLRPCCEIKDVERMRSLFKRICVYFATNSSDQVIEAQARDILQRIPRNAPMPSRISTRSATSAQLPVSADDHRILITADLDQPANLTNEPEEDRHLNPMAVARSI